MEKLIELYDSFNKFNTDSQFSMFLVTPVITVIFCVILVFVFGFRKPEEPKFKKISDNTSSSGSSKSKTKKKNSNSNVLQKNNLLNSTNNANKKSQDKPGGILLSSQQVGTLSPPNKKLENNNAKKESSPKKSSPSQQHQSNQNSIKPVLSKKLDNVIKNQKDDPLSNKVSNKKSKSNVEKNQILKGDGWQTVQSRTDKKNKKTDNEIVAQINTIGATNFTVPKSPKKKQNEMKLNSPQSQSTTINSKTSPKSSKNNYDDKTITSVNDLENDQNFGNVQEKKKPFDDKQVSVVKNQFSTPSHMTSEEFEEYVRSRQDLNNETITSTLPSSLVTSVAVINNSESDDATKINNDKTNTNEIVSYNIQNTMSETSITDKLMDSSAKITNNQMMKLIDNSAIAKKATFSFIENEKSITEFETNPKENVAFDELGDAWTETKTQKKNKKRVRKE